MVDYDSYQNNTIRVYVNTYFLDSLALTFFATSPLEVEIIERDLTENQKTKIQSLIYRYFPGVWIYFFGGDFNIYTKLTVLEVESVDSDSEGRTILNNLKGIVDLRLEMAGDGLDL